MTPANQAIDAQLPGGKPVAKRFNILRSEVGQDDRFHAGFDDGLASFGEFINRDCHPNELSIPEESLLRGLVASGEFFQREGNDEILLNGLEDIIDNRRRCDFAFVIPVVIQKAMDQQLS